MRSKGFLFIGVLCALFLVVSWTLQAEAARAVAKDEAKPAAEVNYYHGGGGGPYKGGGGRNGGGPYKGGGGRNGGGPYKGRGGGRRCYHGCCGPRNYRSGICRCCASAEEANSYKDAAAKP